MTWSQTQNSDFNHVYRELVGTVVDHALLAIDSKDLNRVNNLLQERHSISTDDVFNYPEHLKSVLMEIYGDSYFAVLDKMKSLFKMASNENSISDFIDFLEN